MAQELQHNDTVHYCQGAQNASTDQLYTTLMSCGQ